jgi:hypothetical protein
MHDHLVKACCGLPWILGMHLFVCERGSLSASLMKKG